MQKNLVTIEGNRDLNFFCVGHGSPSVIFETGLGSHLLHWQKLVGPISELTRTCFYDRAGYGFSDPSRHASTAANAVRDLHVLVQRAGVQRPFVLVGHSLGGLYATLYADRHVEDVAGLVLIDPAFAEQDKDQTPKQFADDRVTFQANIAQLRTCAALARSGKLASEPHAECFAFAKDRTDEEKAFLTYQMVRPYRYEAMAYEAESQHSADGKSDVNSREERSARRTFGRMPVTVLTAAEDIRPEASPAERASSARLWGSWKRGHDELAARSHRGQSVVVSGTGHFIQLDKPEAVIDAIKDVVATVRGGGQRVAKGSSKCVESQRCGVEAASETGLNAHNDLSSKKNDVWELRAKFLGPSPRLSFRGTPIRQKRFWATSFWAHSPPALRRSR
jgi:pimeloyl-ACP methyl ester carboxylesterase